MPLLQTCLNNIKKLLQSCFVEILYINLKVSTVFAKLNLAKTYDFNKALQSFQPVTANRISLGDNIIKYFLIL